MMQAILVTFKNLQGSFSGFFKSIAEAVGPIIKLLGPIVSIFTSIGAIASSVGRVIFDVFGSVTAVLGTALPLFTAVARLVELIAGAFQRVAQFIGAVITPIKALFNVNTDTATDGVNGFFDNMMKGLEGVGAAIDSFKNKWSEMVLNVGLVGLRGGMKLRGASEKEIQAAEIDYKERFKTQTGLTEAVDLRSLKVPAETLDRLEARDRQLGTGSARALAISKEWADVKQKAYQNEIKALEQGLSLMTKQKELAEAMSAAAAARRALEARGYELGVQVAASPEAKAAAEARLADLKLSQEKEAISERRGILQTERELQQRQMLIQEKQIKIQQEQLKIQKAEAEADRVRVKEDTQNWLRVRGNMKARSPEWMAATTELNKLAAQQTLNNAKVAGAREALRYAFEAEGQLGTINGLETQRLGLQEQQLDIQGQNAQYTREQQRLLAQISAEDQKITNTLTRATNEQNRKKQALERQSEEITRQITLGERQERLLKAQAELASTRAKAEVQAAQRLAEVQELQDRARNGGGTTAVIEAQIAAAAAGVSGMETAAQVQERLYRAREQQMNREQELQRRQLEVQQKREESELRIQRLKLQSQQVDAALQRANILAEISRLTLKQRQDAISPQLAGATSVPGLGAVSTASMVGKGGSYLQGNIGPTSTGPHFDVKRVGGGFFTRNYLDQFVEVNGRPLSSGTTVSGGTFAGHQARGSHGWDYAFGDGRFAATLKGGAEWMDGIPTAHGERRRFRLPTGEVFQFLHGRSEGIGSGAVPALAGTRAAAPVARTVAAAGGTVAPSTANQAEGLQQQLKAVDERDRQINDLLQGLDEFQKSLKDIFALNKENLREQQQAEQAQFRYEQARAQLTAQVMKTPEGRMAIATSDAVSGGISGSLSGALQAALSGGDVEQAVASALTQVGQTLMQATLDSLLNPLLQQLQNGIVKAITGFDIQGGALQAASGTLQGAGAQLTTAAQAFMAAATAGGAGGAGGGDLVGTLLKKLPSLFSGLAGIADFSSAFSGSNALDFGAAGSLPSLINTGGFGGAGMDLSSAFTPGRAGGGEIQYGLDYLVGERNVEIVRFNKSGGRVFSNRALTQALGVPFQRSPGGGTAVADGVPFQRASSPSVTGRGDTGGIPFLKGNGDSGSAGGLAGPNPMVRSNSLRLSVDTQVINGVEYATVEQVRQAAAAAAQAGRDSVYNDLRNNPSVQQSLGLRG